MLKTEYMNFGGLRKAYDSARHDYYDDIMHYIFSLIGTSSKLLDAGCGTGIATRQLLSKLINISGCDIDEKMIEKAKEYGDEIHYHVAPTDNLPFEDEEFDVITAFGAFHWFCDVKSLTEIKRVLKNGGTLIVVNKNDTGDFRTNYEEIVEKITGEKSPQSVKVGYNPSAILSQNGFSNIVEKNFLHSEKFTISRAITQIQSMSLWNLIPENKKEEALEIFRSLFRKLAIGGMIHRELKIAVVSGNK